MLKEQIFLNRVRTIGEMPVDGKFECCTLEDKVRPVKITGAYWVARQKRKILSVGANRTLNRLFEKMKAASEIKKIFIEIV
ncbi:hypothetical protein [Nitrosovibrio sp. Nv4]|uniref:hypothetical protein n=1 Tax=Nitrosovibrio sp. Nv4 TaxID=1945880 RepID=UPI000BC39632|nr:hypothetical protein [Nitrosovibrio sp. Nv4]SOD42175.1 hypothetical protein SAMN06298226_2506 [Nitrosovibrio sp. Nv4]